MPNSVLLHFLLLHPCQSSITSYTLLFLLYHCCITKVVTSQPCADHSVMYKWLIQLPYWRLHSVVELCSATAAFLGSLPLALSSSPSKNIVLSVDVNNAVSEGELSVVLDSVDSVVDTENCISMVIVLVFVSAQIVVR